MTEKKCKLDKEKFASRLREAIGDTTQVQAANDIDVSPGTLSKWLNENDHTGISADQLIAIKRTYPKVSIDHLLGVTDEKPKYGLAAISESIDSIKEQFGDLASIVVTSSDEFPTDCSEGGMCRVEKTLTITLRVDNFQVREAEHCETTKDKAEQALKCNALIDYYANCQKLSAVGGLEKDWIDGAKESWLNRLQSEIDQKTRIYDI